MNYSTSSVECFFAFLGDSAMAQLFCDCEGLPPRYLQALGYVTFQCALLERNVERLIWASSKIGKKFGRLLASPLISRFKFESLEVIAEKTVKDRSLKAKLLRLAKSASKVANERNKYIHGVWMHPQKANGSANKRAWFMVHMSGHSKKRWLPRAKHMTTAKLLRFGNRARAVNKRASALLEHYYHGAY